MLSIYRSGGRLPEQTPLQCAIMKRPSAVQTFAEPCNRQAMLDGQMDDAATADARERLTSLAKPPGSLGTLEDWAETLCAVQGTLKPAASPQTVLVFCSDHGVKKADEMISPFPASVSQAVFRSLCAGISGTAVLACVAGAHLTVIDVGLDAEVAGVAGASPSISVRHPKVASGTADMRTGPAMDHAQLARALEVGREAVALEVAERGTKVVAVGEVGIGNTTAAAALLAALTDEAPESCCGRGTGLDDAGLEHKQQTVRRACEAHREAIGRMCEEDIAPVFKTAGGRHEQGSLSLISDIKEEVKEAARACEAASRETAREALRRLGGFEIAAMVGAYICAERQGVVAVVDGFISAVAALCAVRMAPECRRAMIFATDLAEEPGATRGGETLAAALGAPRPALRMGLRLGDDRQTFSLLG